MKAELREHLASWAISDKLRSELEANSLAVMFLSKLPVQMRKQAIMLSEERLKLVKKIS